MLPKTTNSEAALTTESALKKCFLFGPFPKELVQQSFSETNLLLPLPKMTVKNWHAAIRIWARLLVYCASSKGLSVLVVFMETTLAGACRCRFGWWAFQTTIIINNTFSAQFGSLITAMRIWECPLIKREMGMNSVKNFFYSRLRCCCWIWLICDIKGSIWWWCQMY